MVVERGVLTPIERAKRALTFQEVDRVALGGGFITHAPAIEAASGIRPMWNDPDQAMIEAYRRWKVDAILQFVPPKRMEDQTSYGDILHETNFRASSNPDALRANFPGPEAVFEYVKRLPTATEFERDFDFQAEYGAWLDLIRSRQDFMPDILWIPGHKAGVVKFMWYSQFSFESYLMALALDPEIMNRLFELEGVKAHLRNQAIAKCIRDNDLFPLIYLGEDRCYNRGPLANSKLLREIYFPHLEYGFRPLKEAGIKILWHTDGLAREVVPDLLAAGVDGFQGFQEELGMTLADYKALRTRDGDPLILWGSILVTRTLPFGTVDDVRAEVERCIDTAQPGGGFVLMPSSSVGPEVPVENIQAMYEHAHTYGSAWVANGGRASGRPA